jgi:hypothetical protein
VSVGDSIQFSVVTPAWATNPTQVLLSGFVYIE